MTRKEIERLIFTGDDRGRPSWKDTRFRTKGGSVIGRVRHSTTGDGPTLAKDGDGRAYWHYHETDGKPHCTRRIYGKDIGEALGEGGQP